MKENGTIVRTINALLAGLALVLVLAFPAGSPAQAQATADQYGPGGGGTVEKTDLVAELAVECPENASRVVGYRLVTTGVESLTSVALTDADGDGVLTGTQTFPRFPPGGGTEPITVDDVRIVAPDGGTVEQFGPVTLDRGEVVLGASVSLCDGGGGVVGPGDGAASEQYGGAVGGPAPADGGGGPAELPETGGASLAIALGAGALLVGGGLLLGGLRR